MRLRSLYSNDTSRFPRIDFRDGLNVVFARVRNPDVETADSHNLGKTFLIQVLDFALLGNYGGGHAFNVRSDLFGDFVFLLEIQTASGAYVTIRRPVTGRAAICIHVSEKPSVDLNNLAKTEWTHHDLGLEKARTILNATLNLTAILPYRYRKGLGYVLRRQTDYRDEFQIARFQRGKDVDWKPFVALLLGFDHDLVQAKYQVDGTRSAKRRELEDLEESGKGLSAELDEVRGLLGVRGREVERLRAQVGSFDFVEIEAAISRRTVRDIEGQIADLNEGRFTLEREAHEIDRALETDFGFDLEGMTEAFAEAEMALPGQLVKSYEELVAFNESMSAGRRSRLTERRSELSILIGDMDGRLHALNKDRVDSLSVLTQRETLEKFKALQRDVLRREEELVALRHRLSQLGEAGRVLVELRNIETERLKLISAIEDMVSEGSDRYETIRKVFSDFVHAILSVSAVLATRVNNEGNLDFQTKIVEERDANRETAEAEGTSYRKALCVCIDLAMLVTKAKAGFYRFVYHDGVFEGFDNRRKASLLQTARRICAEHGLQYILTVIDADLPRDERDNKVLFTDDEIVRELHDQGKTGRLFRMEAF